VILLDTNVVSALMQELPDARVVTWLNRQPTDTVWTTSITVFEVEVGLALMSEGRRRRRMTEAFRLVLRDDLGGRVAMLDHAAASAAARLSAHRSRVGRPVDVPDTLIAGIALARHAGIVTRNVSHFHGAGIPVIDPWHAA
jgi:predicted nucleic acid-binding protein